MWMQCLTRFSIAKVWRLTLNFKLLSTGMLEYFNNSVQFFCNEIKASSIEMPTVPFFIHNWSSFFSNFHYHPTPYPYIYLSYVEQCQTMWNCALVDLIWRLEVVLFNNWCQRLCFYTTQKSDWFLSINLLQHNGKEKWFLALIALYVAGESSYYEAKHIADRVNKVWLFHKKQLFSILSYHLCIF